MNLKFKMVTRATLIRNVRLGRWVPLNKHADIKTCDCVVVEVTFASRGVYNCARRTLVIDVARD